MKVVLCFFLGLILLSACTSHSNHTIRTSAPVEDKSLMNRNPYAPATAQIFEKNKQKTEIIKPNLRLEEEELPSSEPKKNASRDLLVWPTNNTILNHYDPLNNKSKGINFSGKVGDPIRAAGSGKVVFSGSGLKGYGNLIIIKHNNHLLTAYAYNHQLLVKEGELVDAGQVIAEIGLNEQTGIPTLHFEVRLHGKPVNPMAYLPLS